MLSCLQYESSPNSFTHNIKRDFIEWQSLCLHDNVATSPCLFVSNTSHVPTLLHMTLKEISAAAVDDDGTGMAPSLCSIFSGSLTKVKRKCCHWQSFCYPTMWWCGLTSSIHHRKWFLHKTYLPMSYRVCSGKKMDSLHWTRIGDWIQMSWCIKLCVKELGTWVELGARQHQCITATNLFFLHICFKAFKDQ